MSALSEDTSNRTARIAVAVGLRAMRQYRESIRSLRDQATGTRVGKPKASTGPRDVLGEAEKRFKEALEADPAYVKALYYLGIARELKGETNSAIESLQKVVESKPSFSAEARFNLGVAYFHKYHPPDLEKAKVEFDQVLEQRFLSRDLRLLCLSSLAQVYAQLMIQPNPEQPDTNDLKQQFGRVQQLKTKIERQTFWRKATIEVRWRLCNAVGLGYMFASDYLQEISVRGGLPLPGRSLKRQEMIKTALDQFERADRSNPNNWAIICNLGSIWMRKAYWAREGKERDLSGTAFKQSTQFLDRVIDGLRPEYGFALYEKGRLNRVTERFDEAIGLFEKARSIPPDDRDVSDKTINRELERAKQKRVLFP